MDFYPNNPELLEPLSYGQKKYKQQAWLAILSLVFFVILYLFLTGWFVWTTYRMFSEVLTTGDTPFSHYLVGFFSLFLSVFLLKGLLFRTRGYDSDSLEITAKDQPDLFAFLYRLADDARAPRPAKVYVSPRVNACVFYDLSVLSLFFPSRKNLEIGLPLVNVLSLSEFKAVLAHEFGHFAQRSMAIGRWVYIAQQVATQIVYKRDMLDKFLRGILSIDLRVAWIGWILSLIIWALRSLLDTVFSGVVLAQRALSRQMEFQADLVAVSLTGSDELVHALHKLQGADEAWEGTLSFANKQLGQKKFPADWLQIQRFILDKTAEILGDASYGKTPDRDRINPATHRVFKSSFAQPPQMWATHPANADREDNAKQQYIDAKHDDRSSWILFADYEALWSRLVHEWVKIQDIQEQTWEETKVDLQKEYAQLRLSPRYRGVYLNGRSLTRHTRDPKELYQTAFVSDVVAALERIYPEHLTKEVEKLRELQEEHGLLEAVKNKDYTVKGKKIVFRGDEISARDLPSALVKVKKEILAAQEAILQHDKQCRAVHLSIAKQLGGGWQAYLQGLLHVLHYAEHVFADLQDAQALLANVVAVVTADGRVSSSELKRLLAAANGVYGVMAKIDAQKSQLLLGPSLCARANRESWSKALGDFELPPATQDNINDWMQVIDGWVGGFLGELANLRGSALEELLAREDFLADCFVNKMPLDEAPAPSVVPSDYAMLLDGQERKKQRKLGLWDRFQVAEGFFPSAARLLIALAIVGGVLGFSFFLRASYTVNIFNGLDRALVVDIEGKTAQISAFSSAVLDVEARDALSIETKTIDGALVQRLQPAVGSGSSYYVYNIMGASPLVKWTASYGNVAEVPPEYLGAKEWLAIKVSHYFEEPPESISSQHGGGSRSVLSGFSNVEPEKILGLVESERERANLIQAHAKWDTINGPYKQQWMALAKGLPTK